MALEWCFHYELDNVVPHFHQTRSPLIKIGHTFPAQDGGRGGQPKGVQAGLVETRSLTTKYTDD